MFLSHPTPPALGTERLNAGPHARRPFPPNGVAQLYRHWMAKAACGPQLLDEGFYLGGQSCGMGLVTHVGHRLHLPDLRLHPFNRVGPAAGRAVIR